MTPAKKTLYVKDEDAPLWERFEKAVKEWQEADSVSSLVATAMRGYLDQYGDQGDGLYIRPPDADRADGPPVGAVAVLERNGGFWQLDAGFEEEDGPYTYLLSSRDLKGAIAEAKQVLAKEAEDQRSVNFESITVDCEDRHSGRTWNERFMGRWLVTPDSDETRASESDYDSAQWDTGYYWGVALTMRGQFAVYSAHCNDGGGHLDVYPDLATARDHVPASIVAAAESAMTSGPLTIDRDI